MRGVVAEALAFAKCLVDEANVAVPAGTLAAESATSSGVYKLAVIVTNENPNGSATELAGFSEGPVIQMREP